MARKSKNDKSRKDHAIPPDASPINGQVPPVETRWKPGQTGNPAGRKTAGATLREHLNSLAEQGLDEPAIRAIAKDVKEPWPRRAAANRILRTMEAGDLSDFAGLLRGDNTIEDLRAMGINTEVVKKFKQKTRVVPKGEGSVEEVIDREIELHDRAGADFDRVIDRTVGKPVQAIDVTGEVEHTHTIDLSKLNDDELRVYRELRLKMAGDASAN